MLHGTTVVTIHTDGTYTLRSGGYRTPTTMDRIQRYSPMTWQTLISEKGDWYVAMKPVDRDPRPERVERTVPKPYTPGDWIEEPVKDTEGCVAGQMVTTHHVKELVEIYRRDMLEHDVIEEVVSHGHGDDDAWDRVKVKRTWNDHVYTPRRRAGTRAGPTCMDNRNVHSNSFINDDGETVKRVQCAHCAEFDAMHESWRRWMHGDRYGNRFDSPKQGYASLPQDDGPLPQRQGSVASGLHRELPCPPRLPQGRSGMGSSATACRFTMASRLTVRGTLRASGKRVPPPPSCAATSARSSSIKKQIETLPRRLHQGSLPRACRCPVRVTVGSVP